MSATLAPFGLRAAYHPTGNVRAVAYNIATSYSTTLYKNQAVVLNTNGTVTTVAAGSNDWTGVFVGCEYFDAQGKYNVSPYWPASQATLAGSTITAWVIDDPDVVFEVQADGSVAQTALGDQANFSSTSGYTNADGSTTTGLSAMAMSSSLAGAGSQGQLRIVAFGKQIDNAVGDAYTIVQVQNARHTYRALKVAI